MEQILAEDLHDNYDLWPTIVPYAVDIGLDAVFAFPLQLRSDCIGALNARSRNESIRLVSRRVVDAGSLPD